MAIDASDPQDAYRRALALGEEEEWAMADGEVEIFFEFVGVLQMIERTLDESHELWWELDEMAGPTERIASLLPPKNHLLIFDGPPASERRLGFNPKRGR